MDLRPLDSVDARAIESLLDAAFGTDRMTRAAYRIRAGLTPLPIWSAVMTDGGVMVGSIQCFAVALHRDADSGGGAQPLIMVGPIAVDPARQNEGIGRAMLRAMLARIDAVADAPPQVLIGDAPYYEPFGFSGEATRGWRVPGTWDPARLLARGWSEGRDMRGLIGPPAR